MLYAFRMATTLSSRSFSSRPQRPIVEFVFHRPRFQRIPSMQNLLVYEVSAHHTDSSLVHESLERFQKHAQRAGFQHTKIVVNEHNQNPYLLLGFDPLNLTQFLSQIGHAVNSELHNIIDAQTLEPSATKNKP